MSGPSEHLLWNELACKDSIRTPYPLDWRDEGGRVEQLAALFEHIRAGLGRKPLRVGSAYRTAKHNADIGGAEHSQHVQGRALDLARLKDCTVDEFHSRVQTLVDIGPYIGGLGLYKWGVHIDIRPGDKLVTWFGG